MRSRQSGYSLAELTLVVAGSGLLISLLLPAVEQQRESARATQCAANLKKIGEAAQSFTKKHGGVLPHNQQVAPFTSWNTQLLSHMGEDKVVDKYDFSQDWWDRTHSENQKVGENRIATFLCPAAPGGKRWVYLQDPDDHAFQAAPVDYVAVAGAYLHSNDQENLHRGAMAGAGRYYGASGVTGKTAVRMNEVKDGASHTLLIAEMADKPNSWRAGKLHEQAGGADAPKMLVPSFSFGQWIGPNWNHYRSHDIAGDKQFGPCAVNCSNSAAIYGFHQGGAYALFVDGSVQFVKAGLAEEVMVSLVSIDGGEVVAASDYQGTPANDEQEPSDNAGMDVETEVE